MGVGNTSSFFWASSAAEVTAGYRAIRETGRIPVLRPSDDDRAARWNKVLVLYHHDHARVSITNSSSADLLVCVTTDYWPIVHSFAEATGRPVLYLEKMDGDLPALDSADTITVVGHDRTLRMMLLQRLATVLTKPWGILPAADLAGLTFVLAKCLADQAMPRTRWALLDAISGVTRSNLQEQATLDGDLTRASLTEADWDVIALCAHGENGHCNLNTHVLCGLTGSEERTADGVLLRGCYDQDGIRACKRRRANMGVIRMTEVKARHILLFSCTNFSVAGDLYPSNVSLVTAALDGYAASILSCDRALPYSPAAGESLLAMAIAGTPLSALREAENDHHQRRSGCRPYFLAGDALARGSERVGTLPLGTEILVSGWPPFLIGAIGDDSGPAAITAVRPPGVKVVRGQRLVRVSADLPGAKVSLHDATGRLTEYRLWERRWASRRMNAERLVRAVRDLQPGIEVPAPLHTAVTTLQRIGQGASRLAEQAVRTGLWESALDEVTAISERYATAWGYSFCGLLSTGLLQHNAWEQILVDGLRFTRTQAAGNCEYCESPLYDNFYTDVHLSGSSRFRHCPHCGPREFTSLDNGKISIMMPREFFPGRYAEIKVSVSDDFIGSLLVAELKDNGNNLVWWQLVTEITAVETRAEVLPPADSAADMFTLRAVAIKDLDIMYHRLRKPCIAVK